MEVMSTNSKINGIPWLRLIIPYVILGLVYIYYSDIVLERLVQNVGTLSTLQTVKGFGFIGFTGFLLFYLSKKNVLAEKQHLTMLIADCARKNEALKNSEDKYWRLFHDSPLPMWIFDVNTLRFLLVNDAAVKKYGYTKEEYASMTLKDIRPTEDIPDMMDALNIVKGSDRWSWSRTFRHIKKDGTIIHVKLESTATQLDGREARLVSAMDITHEIVQQEALVAANTMLHAASSLAGIGYWRRDMRTNDIEWTEELHDIFETDKDNWQPTEDGIVAMFHPDDRDHFRQSHGKGFHGQSVIEYEHRIVTAKGNEKWIKERIMITAGADGKPVKLEGVAMDVTVGKKIAQSLMESNERYEMVQKATAEAIIDWDLTCGKVVVSNGFKELFGHDIAACEGMVWLSFIHPEDKVRVHTALRNALRNVSDNTFYAEFRFLKADGTIAHVRHRGVFIRRADGRVTRAVGAMEDVTGLVEKMQRIELQNDKLREIAWVQSHIVRGPLSTLMGLTRMLRDKDEFEIDESFVTSGILETADKLDSVVRHIVKLSEQLTLESNS